MIEHVGKDLDGLVAVKFSGPVSLSDYEVLIPEMERQIKQCGRINFYMEIRDGVIWEGEDFWSDMNFNLRHAQDIRKVAFVGNDEWEEKIISLIRPLENAEIRWYNFSDSQEALKWVST